MEKMLENTLKRLLERDPGNIQGLHRLIVFYEQSDPGADVQFLRRRLLEAKSQFNRVEMLIRAYHLCKEKRYHDVLDFIEQWHHNVPQISTICLIKAHVFGELRQYTRKRLVLAEFKEKCQGKEEIMQLELQEFGFKSRKKCPKTIISSSQFHLP
jgi:SNF2 family DNA or RNA helicase